MKRIVIALLVVTLAAAAVPYLFGLRAEAALRDGLMQFSRLQPDAQAQIVDWKRGWLSSTAVTVMTLEVGGADTRQLRLRHRIAHGPLPYTSDGPASPALAVVETWADSHALLQGAPDRVDGSRRGLEAAGGMRTLTVVGFDGTRRMRATIPPLEVPIAGPTQAGLLLAQAELRGEQAGAHAPIRFQLRAPEVSFDRPDEGRLRLTDVDLGGEVAADLAAFGFELRAAHALFDAKGGGHIAFQGVVIAQAAKRDASGLWLGDFQASSARAAVGPPGTAEGAELSALRLATSAVNDAGALTLTADLSGAVHLPEGWLPVALTGASLGLRVSGLDAAAVAALQAESEPRAAGMTLTPGTTAALRDVMAASLPRTPQLDIHGLTLRSTEGDLVARLQLRLGDDRAAIAPYSPLALLLALQGKAHAAAPQAMLVPILATRWRRKLDDARELGVLDGTDDELVALAVTRATAELQALVTQGLVRQEADRLLVDATLDGGQITVNGQPLTLPLGLMR